MKVKLIIAVFVFAAVGLLTSLGFTETIHFTDGSVVDEKIIERSSYYGITKTDKKLKKYYLNQIDYIEEDEAGDVNDNVPVDLSQYADIAEDKVRLIFNLIDVSGVRAAMKQNIKQTWELLPAISSMLLRSTPSFPSKNLPSAKKEH